MKVTVGIIDKCGMRGDATLCVVIFIGILTSSDKFIARLQYHDICMPISSHFSGILNLCLSYTTR